MRTNLVVRAVGILILLAPWPIAAQDVETLSGSLPGWSVTPGISVGAGYDSNVALQNTPADTGQTVSDELILIQPTAHLDFLSPRTQFSSGYHGNMRRYFELDQLNGFDQRGYASLRRLASKRVTLAMSDNYARTPTTDDLDLYGVPFVRTGARRNTFGGGVDTRLTKFMDLSVGVDHTWVAFDRTRSLLTGGWVAGGRVALSRRMTEHLSVGGEYGLRFAEMNENTRNLTFQDAGATVRIGLAQRTSAGAAVGVAFLNDRSLGEKRQGPYVRADVTRNTERVTIGAAFERTFIPSFGFGGSTQSEMVRGFVRMPLERNRMYVEAALSWRRSDPFLNDALALQTSTLRSVVGYSLARHLQLEGLYALSRQDTPVAGGDVNRSRIGIQIVVSQPMRIQ
jgi:hypothetical protein